MADPTMAPVAPHPILSGGTFGLMSGEKPMHRPESQATHEHLVGMLHGLGLPFEETHGRYEQPERSVIVHGPSRDQMFRLGKMFGQDSVVWSQGGKHELLYTNGPHEGKSRLVSPGAPAIETFQQPPVDYYTHLPNRGYFRINFDWEREPGFQAPQQMAPAAPAPAAQPVAKSEALARPGAHPHAYPWHEGHTDHNRTARNLAHIHRLHKADVLTDQNAPIGVSSYARFAGPYGQVLGQQSPTNLRHYPYEGHNQAIDDLVKRHGYQVYYAGGRYGKPDLAQKNYNTGHLMVYDPGSAGSFNEDRYTDSWRKIHELAHALTYPELNSIYGEGRRIGKLGVHRTPNEAMRAVHWEWLAAHKQRELGEQLGIKVPDETFHRELNTVMHDAVHRAVTSQFTEPSGEGFAPHAHKVDLASALDTVREHAKSMGIQGQHQLAPKGIRKALAKGWPMDPDKPAGQTVDPGLREKYLGAARSSPDVSFRHVRSGNTQEQQKDAVRIHEANQPRKSKALPQTVDAGKNPTREQADHARGLRNVLPETRVAMDAGYAAGALKPEVPPKFVEKRPYADTPPDTDAGQRVADAIDYNIAQRQEHPDLQYKPYPSLQTDISISGPTQPATYPADSWKRGTAAASESKRMDKDFWEGIGAAAGLDRSPIMRRRRRPNVPTSKAELGESNPGAYKPMNTAEIKERMNLLASVKKPAAPALGGNPTAPASPKALASPKPAGPAATSPATPNALAAAAPTAPRSPLVSPKAAGTAAHNAGNSPFMAPSAAEGAAFKKLVSAIPPKGTAAPGGAPTVASAPKPSLGAKLTSAIGGLFGKSEDAEAPVILTKPGTAMPIVETTYTPAEAVEILKKAARAKIQALETELKDLRKREAAKSMIPPHKHNSGSSVSAGMEDVPPGKLHQTSITGKPGTIKQEMAQPVNGSNIAMGEPMEDTPGEETSGERSPADVLDDALHKEELCKECGEMHKAGMCKNATLGYGPGAPGGSPAAAAIAAHKAELTDPKGKTHTTGLEPSATLPDDAKHHVNEPAHSNKNAGSGGTLRRGKSLKSMHKSALESMTKGSIDVSPPPPATAIEYAKVEPLAKPSTSGAQHRAMEAAAHGHSTLGIPKKVGEEFSQADKGKHFKAEPPMAKPPSGVNMATKVPTSVPKMGKTDLPGAPSGSSGGMLSGADGGAGSLMESEPQPQHGRLSQLRDRARAKRPLGKGVMADVAHRESAHMGAPIPTSAPKASMPTQGQHEQRAAGHAAALSGAFQPKGPVVSGLELDTKPKATLTSPRAAGAAPTRPGIFGKLPKLGAK